MPQLPVCVTRYVVQAGPLTPFCSLQTEINYTESHTVFRFICIHEIELGLHLASFHKVFYNWLTNKRRQNGAVRIPSL